MLIVECMLNFLNSFLLKYKNIQKELSWLGLSNQIYSCRKEYR